MVWRLQTCAILGLQINLLNIVYYTNCSYFWFIDSSSRIKKAVLSIHHLMIYKNMVQINTSVVLVSEGHYTHEQHIRNTFRSADKKFSSERKSANGRYSKIHSGSYYGQCSKYERLWPAWASHTTWIDYAWHMRCAVQTVLRRTRSLTYGHVCL